jgi:hypothetical protein
MRILHIAQNSNGFEEVTLISNRISRKNGLALIEKNGQRFMIGGFLINDTPQIRQVLNNIPREEQYSFVNDFKIEPFAKLYSDENEVKES